MDKRESNYEIMKRQHASCKRLGGVPYGKGDVGYRFPVFRDLQAAVQFWEKRQLYGVTV